MHRIAAVVLTYRPDVVLLGNALAALRPQVERVIMVDNGGGWDPDAVLAARVRGGDIELIRLERNLGVGAGHNRGIRRARELGFPHVLIMDHDSVPAPGMVRELAAALERLSAQGIPTAAVGPRYVDRYTGHTSSFVRLGRWKPRRVDCDPGRRGQVIETDFIISSGALIPMAVLDAVGGMNEDFFIDHVDTEWIFRARARGYLSFGVCDALMEHGLGTDTIRVWLGRWRSVPLHSPERHYYAFRNGMALARMPHAPRRWVVNDLVRLTAMAVIYPLFVPDRLRRVRLMALGLWHGLRRTSGALGEARKATRRDKGPGLRVLCIMSNTALPLAEIRLLRPLGSWARLFGGEVRVRHPSEIWDCLEDRWPDVVVFQREANRYVLRLINYVRAMDVKVVFDIDDLLSEMPEFLVTHEYHRRNKKSLQKVLQAADAVTVTNARLGEALRSCNDRIAIIPNCASPPARSPIARHASHREVKLLIAATDTVRLDFMLPVLTRLLEQEAIRFKLIGIGAPGRFLAAAGLKVQLHDNMPYAEFKEFVASLDDAIGLIPLDDSKFSSCKSAIKFIDYSLCGVVTVCSAVPPYSDVVVDGQTGLLAANDAASWYDAIMRLARSPQLRSELVAAAGAQAEQRFNMGVAAQAWQDLFATLRNESAARPTTRASLWRLRLTLLADYVTSGSTYTNAVRVLRREGVQGVRRRLRRFTGG